LLSVVVMSLLGSPAPAVDDGPPDGRSADQPGADSRPEVVDEVDEKLDRVPPAPDESGTPVATSFDATPRPRLRRP
jgi:hypothetical protein